MHRAARSPVAIVGLSTVHAGADGLEQTWASLVGGRVHVERGRPARWTSEPADTELEPPIGAFLDDIEVGVDRFGIPPAQAVSIARAQLLFLELVDRALDDAGASERPIPADRTDVICGTCFGFDRTYANALRVEAGRAVTRFAEARRTAMGETEAEVGRVTRELKMRYRARFGGAAHDRIGEMASTIPARISIAHKLRGRSLAVESADATSFVVLWTALNLLRQGSADLVVAAAGQLWDSPLGHASMAAKGLLSKGVAEPFAAEGGGFSLGEGVSAVVLKRVEDAERDGDRIRAVIAGASLGHTARRGTFRYSTSQRDRQACLRAALANAAWSPSTVQVVESFGSAVRGETELELEALAAVLAEDELGPREVLVGSARANFGHTFAEAGFAGLTKLVLSLERATICAQPKASAPARAPLPGLLEITRDAPRAWPKNLAEAPRRAVLSGASMTGTIAHLCVEEYLPSTARPVQIEAGGDRIPIAIVGLGGVLPDAPDAATFWTNLIEGHDAIRPLPDSILDREIYYEPGNLDVFKTYATNGAWIAEFDLERAELPILPARSRVMDAAQRLALIAARQTLADFGYPERRPPQRRAAVVIGSSLCLNIERSNNTRLEYDRIETVLTEAPSFQALPRITQVRLLSRLREEILGATVPLSRFSLDGYLASGVAAAISNEFGLDAVPMVVEAACASSMGALDLACLGLAAGEFDFVIAGGIELPANARDMVICASLRLLSADRITPFDERADGFSIGEGVALFALKRLADARRDGDRVHGVIRGLGASSDAKSLIAPDVEGQTLALKRAFDQVEFPPSAVQFIEMHGTGTRVGDTVEAQAVREVYGGGEPIALGSVKSMVGHTFAAAGAAGLLKTLLALDAGLIPPNVALERVNPRLELDQIPAWIPLEPTPWPTPHGGPRRAAVSSMGTGGINYHLLLEQLDTER